MTFRLTWARPEDLVPHALDAAARDGADVEAVRRRWIAAGRDDRPDREGAGTPGTPDQRRLARTLLDDLDALPRDLALLAAEPDGLDAIPDLPLLPVGDDLADRVHGAWLGRAAGCLLGKPVEKLPREGIAAIAEATGNLPVRAYFTAVGLPDAIAERWPWNRRSRPTSLAERIDGMPEDDDLNFPLIVLHLLEQTDGDPTTDDVATRWLNELPGGRVFTAERIAYRNLLDGGEPDEAAVVGNPFTDWIGAQIRTDVYGWARPGDRTAAARLAWADARLSHRRNGLFGALFAAACASAAVVLDDPRAVLEAGLEVVPPESRYAAAVRFGLATAEAAGSDDAGLDALHERYGDLHWVHVLNNAALLAFAVARGDGDFARTTGLAVECGWDTDSVGATAGAIVGALGGLGAVPPSFADPIHDRLATSVPGEDGARLSALADRTLALVPQRSASRG
ncbi:ADP-ribosylglycohydrolase family protein [Amnibacterium kyonggiense]|uniref:ADP-ribosylglycohydrolase n=1 Tax=Amnibacterium kyonggiense TaxID=595671 RepID=A0A4R7FLE3_9MICO|nr:ADP-ribosylglycohydrolase family protein [Amnibacterium kyonggiense]TDS77232.1 ADP-ribosylglycohydrolase [Amnibacterium kyonggiense]